MPNLLSLPLPPADLQDAIGYRFQEPLLLLQALTHPSFTAENPVDVPHNQRLEFLGDAVIQILVTQRIYVQFPALAEGEMTRLRAILTRQASLARLARLVGLEQFLRVGKGERRLGGHERPSNLCDGFEALVAAIYLDAGHQLAPAQTLLEGLLDRAFPNPGDLLLGDNPKGMLQEAVQRHGGGKPVYETIAIEGPDHQRLFTVRVSVGEECIGTGQGPKRQKAEEDAAKSALNHLRAEGKAP